MTTTEKKSRPKEAAAPELFWEGKVAQSLGLSRERVRALREQHLTPEEWSTRGNAVVLTAAGLEKIAAAVKAEAAQAEPVQAGPVEPTRLMVRKLCRNPRLMLAVTSATAEASVVVRVKDNTAFMLGMVFDALPLADGTYQFTGRLPRSRGRW